MEHVNNVKQVITALRREDQQRRENIKKAIYEQRHNESLQIKRQREINELLAKERNTKILEQKRSKSQAVKEDLSMSTIRKNDYYLNRLKQYQMSHEEEMEFQEKLKKKKQAETQILERLETEVVRKLQETHSKEKEAYRQLEEALYLSPEEYEMRYKTAERLRGLGSRKSSRNSTPLKLYREEKSLRDIRKADLDLSMISDRKNSSFIIDKVEKRRSQSRNGEVLGRKAKNERTKQIYTSKLLPKDISILSDNEEGNVKSIMNQTFNDIKNIRKNLRVSRNKLSSQVKSREISKEEEKSMVTKYANSDAE